MKKVAFLVYVVCTVILGCSKEQSNLPEPNISANESSMAKLADGTVDFSSAGSVVTKEEAVKMTNNFQFEVGGIKSHTFSKAILLKLLNQNNVVAARFYHGIENGNTVLVVVGVDKKGTDVGFYLERSLMCPPICPEEEIVKQ